MKNKHIANDQDDNTLDQFLHLRALRIHLFLYISQPPILWLCGCRADQRGRRALLAIGQRGRRRPLDCNRHRPVYCIIVRVQEQFIKSTVAHHGRSPEGTTGTSILVRAQPKQLSAIEVEASRRASIVGRGVRRAKPNISQSTWPCLDVEEGSRPVGRDGGVVGFSDQGRVGMSDCTCS